MTDPSFRQFLHNEWLLFVYSASIVSTVLVIAFSLGLALDWDDPSLRSRYLITSVVCAFIALTGWAYIMTIKP